MRLLHPRLSAAALLVLLAAPATSRAQVSSGVPFDPFLLYYGYLQPQENRQRVEALQSQNRSLQSALEAERSQRIAERADINEETSTFRRDAAEDLDRLARGLPPLRRPRPPARIGYRTITQGRGPETYYGYGTVRSYFPGYQLGQGSNARAFRSR